MYYSIGEMAKLVGIPTSTLRYYDKEGLLPEIERTQSGIRRFQETDYELLQIIECLKQTGMTLKDIKNFIGMVAKGDETISQRLEMFQQQKQQVLDKIQELNATLKILEYKCWYYETAKQAGTTNVHNEMNPEDIPARFQPTINHLKHLSK